MAPNFDPRLYKGFMIGYKGQSYYIYNSRGKQMIGGFGNLRQATDYIDATIARAMKVLSQKKNPLTKAETKNIKAESRIHRKIKKPFYQGVAEGMKDIAEQYGRNPDIKKLSTNKLIRLLEKNYEKESGLNSRMIAAGRGLEKYSESAKKSDPLAIERMALSAEHRRLLDEIKGRETYGEKYYRSISNPPQVEIYDCIKEIIAKKGPGHKCDAECKRAGHTYRHTFSGHSGVFGNPDGSITIRPHKS